MYSVSVVFCYFRVYFPPPVLFSRAKKKITHTHTHDNNTASNNRVKSNFVLSRVRAPSSRYCPRGGRGWAGTDVAGPARGARLFRSTRRRRGKHNTRTIVTIFFYRAMTCAYTFMTITRRYAFSVFAPARLNGTGPVRVPRLLVRPTRVRGIRFFFFARPRAFTDFIYRIAEFVLQ